ncbi:zinc ribbon domain-containing protein [Candidatus Micrarchaeota archaeon]|nr:zinc ribbon domain-containing protein [Candidatus Micrarchaeota archaeon]
MVSPEERDAQALQEKIARIKAKLAEAKAQLPPEAAAVPAATAAAPQKPAAVPSASVEIEVPLKKALSQETPMQMPAKPPAAPTPVPTQPAQKKPGFFAKLFTPKPKPAKPVPQAPQAKPAPVVPSQITSPVLARAELKKAKEKEAELILQDIVGIAEKEAAAAEAAPAGQAPPVHRRYLLKRREKTTAVLPEQAREKEELSLMAAELYPAMKPEEKPAEKPAAKPEKAARPVKPVPEKKEFKKPEKKGAEAPAPGRALTLEEIIGGAPAGGAAPAEAPLFPAAPAGGGGAPLFAELGAITGGPAAKPEEKPVAPAKPIEATAGECPTCHSKNIKVVFCPYCGAGMCFNCSPLVKPEADAMVYTCPKCGEEVTVRKKQP